MNQAQSQSAGEHPGKHARICIFCRRFITEQVYVTVPVVRVETRRGSQRIAYQARAHALCAQERLHVGR